MHTNRRGTEALYSLHQYQQDKLEEKRTKKTQADIQDMKNNTFKNKESDEIRIQGFKKEFRLKLATVVNAYQASQNGGDLELPVVKQPNPRDHVLQFGQVVGICRQMGFIQEKRTAEQDQMLKDLYTIFKCNPD